MLSTYRDPVNSIFGDFFGDYDPMLTTNVLPMRTRQDRSMLQGRLLAVDAWETDSNFVVRCEAPSISKDKLEVNVDNFLLTIKASKPAPTDTEQFNWTRNEIVYGTANRTLRIPATCSQEPSCCTFRDGVLCICFPKSGEQAHKKLNIEA